MKIMRWRLILDFCISTTVSHAWPEYSIVSRMWILVNSLNTEKKTLDFHKMEGFAGLTFLRAQELGVSKDLKMSRVVSMTQEIPKIFLNFWPSSLSATFQTFQITRNLRDPFGTRLSRPLLSPVKKLWNLFTRTLLYLRSLNSSKLASIFENLMSSSENRIIDLLILKIILEMSVQNPC